MKEYLEAAMTGAFAFLLAMAYLAAPVLLMLSDKADKVDVIVALLVPPPGNWAYAAWVLLS